MKTFTIEAETKNIIAHATQQDASGVVNAESFSSAEEPRQRLPPSLVIESASDRISAEPELFCPRHSR